MLWQNFLKKGVKKNRNIRQISFKQGRKVLVCVLLRDHMIKKQYASQVYIGKDKMEKLFIPFYIMNETGLIIKSSLLFLSIFISIF